MGKSFSSAIPDLIGLLVDDHCFTGLIWIVTFVNYIVRKNESPYAVDFWQSEFLRQSIDSLITESCKEEY